MRFLIFRAASVVFLGGVAVLGLGGFCRAEKDGSQPAKEGTRDQSMEHEGATRTYRLHLPKDFSKDRPAPLVIVLHGMGANGKMTEALTGFSELADKKGFVVAYPDGLKKMWRYMGDADPAFIKALIDRLIKEGIVEPRQVYCTGISNGAYLTNVLACDAPERFAAVAAVAGTMSKLKAGKSQPSRSMPLLYIHGTDDPLVGFDGKDFISKRALSLSAEEFVQWWVKHNRSAKEPVVEQLPDKAKDQVTAERRTYGAGKDGALVVFYKIQGGGHTWPGGSFQPEKLLGKTCRNLDASEAMWEFFSKAKLPERKKE